ncbi:MAG: hypothetical protein Q8O67_12060 [Deltaproteobacteria bacterium]|nr:hypothetical protein [Deltaproteobacteria bacterium]
MKLSRAWSSLDVDALPYAAFFCEENVWQLAHNPHLPVPIAARHAVFISNERRTVAMWSQRAAVVDPVLWDYHVVLLADGVVVDVDCTAGAVLPVHEWVAASFRAEVPAEARPRFRVVDAATFLQVFSSDRSHMVDDGGRSVKPAPSWPAPWQPARGMNLMRFVDLDDDVAGFVCDLPGLLAFAKGSE